MKLFPLFADLNGRRVAVVGGGSVAERKTATLLAAGAVVRIGAPELTDALSHWVASGRLDYRQGRFSDDWLEGAWLVIAATDDRDVNRAVSDAAKARGVFVNVVDDAALSSFHVPAIVDRSPLLIAISSGGDAPMLARWVREKLETVLDHSLGPLAALVTRYRQRIRARHPATALRRRFYQRLLAGPVPGLMQRGQLLQAEAELQSDLKEVPAPAIGSVVLVGAGPGDPDLLTIKALRALNEADVILHDRLVSGGVLDLARRDAERIEVGKQAGAHGTSQDRIHALLLEHARAGRRVVRLKGGDPFIFGRGGEELEFLRAHGIAYEVVPGITAAIACAAYAGIPLTHRDHAQAVRFVTAHCRASLDKLDWPALAQERQTLAVYMGVAELDSLRTRLIAHGRAADTPFALIENGSRPDQRVLVGTLAELPQQARAFKIHSPALLILGEVAALAETLHWFGAAPLGKSDLAARQSRTPALERAA